MKGLKIYGDAEGPLGYPMPSELAKELEGVLAGLDSDCKSFVAEHGENGIVHRRVAPSKFELLDGERADISLITTDTIDRDKEVLYPQGGDWRSWQKGGGVVTFAHRYDQLPVGRGLWVKRVTEPENGWLAKTRYTPRPSSWPVTEGWYPDAVFAFVQDGMRGKSIGFIPTEYRKPTEKEIEGRPELVGVRGVIPKWISLEYAVAPIQSNPDAVTIAVGKLRAKGLAVPQSILDEMGIVVPENAQTKPAPETDEPKDEYISRCMAFPDLQSTPEDQRGAVCNSMWEEAQKEKEKGQTKTKQDAPLHLSPDEAARRSRTPAEITKETMEATIIACERVDVGAIVTDTLDRMRGRV